MSSGKLYILQYRPGGEIIEMDTDGSNRRTLVGNLLGNVDGIVIDKKTKTLYWTNMGPAIGPSEGEFFQAGSRCSNSGMATTTGSWNEFKTVSGARTGFFSPELDKLYVAVRKHESQSAEIRVFAPTTQ